MGAWYDKRTSQEVVNLRLWEQLQEAVDIFGLSALDRLFCFMIVRELQTFLKYFQRGLMGSQAFMKQLETFSGTLGDPQRLLRMSHDLHVTCMQFVSLKFFHHSCM